MPSLDIKSIKLRESLKKNKKQKRKNKKKLKHQT